LRGERGARVGVRAARVVRANRIGRQGSARIGGSGTAPRRGAFGSWPRASSRDRCRSEPLSACARTRPGAGTGEAAAKAGWRADCRARDREAGNPRGPALRGRARAPRQPGPAVKASPDRRLGSAPASHEAESFFLADVAPRHDAS